ncbi:MAG: mechanosensitive ion channel [Candidatus Marinimicrobia bacterium]|nr:mechanosensitive ion channel [Candidatus Neomarinimicrobiota bacterium]MCF7880558.1 mechanosensitive ion channel [Candidatus Neomarinimicrobiota bacterium]
MFILKSFKINNSREDAVEFQEIYQRIVTLVSTYGLRIIGSILIFIVGKWVAGLLTKLLSRALNKSGIDKTLRTFLRNITYYGLFVFVIIAAMSNLGIETASFIAVLGAAGLAIGFALQGSLSNFAAGVLIILFKPFKVDDHIEAAGTEGYVEEIQIFKTIIRSFDNKKIILPNSKVMNDNIVNHTAKDVRRLDLTVGIGYDDDIPKAKKVLKDILDSESRILDDPPPSIVVKELGDNSVNLGVRPYINTSDYFPLKFALTEKIKLRFDEEGISFPYPQRDVHLFQQS